MTDSCWRMVALVMAGCTVALAIGGAMQVWSQRISTPVYADDIPGCRVIGEPTYGFANETTYHNMSDYLAQRNGSTIIVKTIDFLCVPSERP